MAERYIPVKLLSKWYRNDSLPPKNILYGKYAGVELEMATSGGIRITAEIPWVAVMHGSNLSLAPREIEDIRTGSIPRFIEDNDF